MLDGIDRRPTHLRVRVDDRQSYVLCECFIRLLYVCSLQRSAACSFKYFRNAASNIIFFIMVMRVHMRVRPLPMWEARAWRVGGVLDGGRRGGWRATLCDRREQTRCFYLVKRSGAFSVLKATSWHYGNRTPGARRGVLDALVLQLCACPGTRAFDETTAGAVYKIGTNRALARGDRRDQWVLRRNSDGHRNIRSNSRN